MRSLITSRRTFIATLSILCLTTIALRNNIDVSMALASIAMAVCASNAYEKRGTPNNKE